MASLQRATLRQLRIFEAAARHLHFGRAAAELHLSQPAVSIQLKQLETDVQLPLFEQMGRRMHLTRAGIELAGHARAILARLREADDAIDGLKGVSAGELHIASTTTAIPISRLNKVISKGSVAGKISRITVCQWLKPKSRAAAA